MGNITADQVVTQKHKRSFTQYGGPRPGNSLRFAGQGEQYMAIDGLTNPQRGGVSPIRVHDPRRAGQYKLVGRTEEPADLPTVTYMFYEKHGAIPRALSLQECPFNVYVVTGKCKDLSDINSGWEDYVEIHSEALITDVDLGSRTSFDADETIENSASATLGAVYAIGPLGFGEVASAEIDREAVDVVYGTRIQCGNCGAPNDGTLWRYGITKSSGAGSPGLPARVIYSVDGGRTYNDILIDGIGATADPTAIDIVGAYLVVVVTSENAYYYSEIDTDTGVPGSFTKVTTGFVATKTPTDIYVSSPAEIYFSANGGYVYRSEDITAGVDVLSAGTATTENLTRIDGNEETIVAVGDNGTVLVSINRGAAFGVTQTEPTGTVDLTAVEVFDSKYFWVGGTDTGVGVVYFTDTGGKTWTQVSFGSSPTAVYDIVFATLEVGYIAFTTSGPTAKIASTFTGGVQWSTTRTRVNDLPVFDVPNRIAVPTTPNNHTLNANNVLIAGLAGNGTDGIIVQGAATIL